MLRLGRVDIGSRCFIGIHSALGLNVQMGDDCSLDDQSLLPDQEIIPSGEGRRGSPAQRATIYLPGGTASQTRWHRVLFGLVHLTITEVMGILMLLPSVLFLSLVWLAFSRGGPIVGNLAMI